MLSRRLRFFILLLLGAGHALGNGLPQSRGEDRTKLWSEAARRDTVKFAFQNPPAAVPDANGVFDLKVVVRDFPKLLHGETLRLRSYYPDRPVGPTIRVPSGQTLKIRLTNHPELAKDEAIRDEEDPRPGDAHNVPHNFGHTNLHTHGLAVSPKPGADDVFRPVAPSADPQMYCYDLKNHVGGTFWYHPHRHCSTAFQLASGMAGALIVDPEPSSALNLDAILGVRPQDDKILIFQQLLYSRKDGSPPHPRRQDVYGGKRPDGVSPKQVVFLINGQLLPVLRMKRYELQRWRCVNACVDFTTNLRVVGPQNDLYPLYRLAVDGLPQGKLEKQTLADRFTLLPGGRSDFLFRPEAPGRYYLVSGELPASQNNQPEDVQATTPLAVIEVSPEEMVPRGQLPDEQQIQACRLKSLNAEVIPKERKRTIWFKREGKENSFKIEGEKEFRSFDPDHTDLSVEAGTTEEWTLKSEGDQHPFHIHVNPFEIIAEKQGGKFDPANEGQWRDTYLMTEDTEVTIRIHFDKGLTGKTVLHCHNLDHEDKGMMMVVVIREPGQPAPPLKAPALPRKAPAWSLPDAQGQRHRLADFAGGPVLLVFVRSIECDHCREQLRALAARRRQLDEATLRVVVVCPDRPDGLARWLADLSSAGAFPFLVLADPPAQVFRDYGCRDRGLLHGTFLIDGTGNVRWQNVADRPFLDIDRLLRERSRLPRPARP